MTIEAYAAIALAVEAGALLFAWACCRAAARRVVQARNPNR